jgi:predicted PP-loop superfamily ATPase
VKRCCQSCGSLYGKMASFLPDGRVLRGVLIGNEGNEPVCGRCFSTVTTASIDKVWRDMTRGVFVRVDEITA